MTTKEKLELYLSNYEGGIAHRSALRYLHKRDISLWDEILELTSFLPDSALPKQRAWHIINETYSIPRCPVDNSELPWREKLYPKFSSMQNMIKDDTFRMSRGKKWDDNEERKEKGRKTYYKNREAGLHEIIESPFANPVIRQKCKDTLEARYGVSNAGALPQTKAGQESFFNDQERVSIAQEKIKQTRIKNGFQRPDDRLTECELYYREVSRITEKSYNEYINIINPKGLERGAGKYHLDHKYSKLQGFNEGIDPEIIGHWTNLEILWHSDNESKNFRCSKTKEQLLEDFNNN